MRSMGTFDNELTDPVDYQSEASDIREAEVLLMEDDTEMRALLTQVLTDVGFDVAAVSAAVDGIDAIETMGEQGGELYNLDVIVLDWCLPGMTGEQFMQWLRGQDPLIPVLVISGFLDETVLEEAGRTGATMALAKPFPVSEFIEAVQALTR